MKNIFILTAGSLIFASCGNLQNFNSECSSVQPQNLSKNDGNNTSSNIELTEIKKPSSDSEPNSSTSLYIKPENLKVKNISDKKNLIKKFL